MRHTRVSLMLRRMTIAVAVCGLFLALAKVAPEVIGPAAVLVAFGGLVLGGASLLFTRVGPGLRRPRVRLAWVMAVIALVAVALRVPVWLEAIGPQGPGWWEAYWREKPARDAWGSPVTIRVARQDDLGSVLARFKTATVRPGLGRGLWIFVDTGGIHEAGRTLASPLGTDLDAAGTPARDFLVTVLKPLGLACKLREGRVIVTSEKSIDELYDYGDHGELFCEHSRQEGPWVPIQTEPPGQ